LRDRSHTIKAAVVQAMKTDRIYRRPEAIPLLERITTDRSVRQHSPGLWEDAGTVVERMLGRDRSPGHHEAPRGDRSAGDHRCKGADQ
jgi:hypothetical protein